jgi:hypothetical protein
VAFLFFSPIRSESGGKLLSPTSDCTPQVWYANHDPDENEFYPEHGAHDIVGADRNPLNQGKKTK